MPPYSKFKKPKKYDDLTRDYGKWILKIIDKSDFAAFYNDEFHGITTEQLEYDSRYLNFSPKFSKTELHYHLNTDIPFYYKSSRSTPTLLFCVDIDAHGGETDAWDVADWIVANYLPHSYSEPSTSGTGVHIYFLASKITEEFTYPCKYIKNIISQFSEFLREKTKEEGFDANVDGVFGAPRLIKFHKNCIDENGLIYSYSESINRGKFIKLPKLPNGFDSLNELMNLDIMTIQDIKDIMPTEDTQDSEVAAAEPDEIEEVVTHSKKKIGSLRGSQSFSSNIISESSAFDRMRKAGYQLSSKLRRPPFPEELLLFYEKNGYGQGSGSDRDQRAKKVCAYLSKHFDESKAINTGDWEKKSIPLLKKYITDDLIKECRGKRKGKISLECLNLCYNVMVSNIKDNHGSRVEGKDSGVPLKSMIKAFNQQKAAGKHNRTCDGKKYKVMKNILIRAGLIEYVTDGKDYVVGKYCVQYKIGKTT